MISIHLPQFEGPLDVLIQLARKREIEIEGVCLRTLMMQIFKVCAITRDTIYEGAESMGYAAYLLWLKSKSLLPQEGCSPLPLDSEAGDWDSPLFDHLVEYCLFKDAAKYLSCRQDVPHESFGRSIASHDFTMPSGLDHVSLSEFAHLFQQILQKSEPAMGAIYEEEWKISDKILWLKEAFNQNAEMAFEVLFNPDRSKMELIVFFLAVLEMMKAGELKIVKKQASIYIYGTK
jgi:segregation and condensation protein A